MVLALALQAVTDGLKLLKTELVKGVETGLLVDEALRGLGTSFEKQAGPLTESMKDLRGSLVDRMVPTILTLQAGLQGNAEGTKELINQQRITGTNYANTAKTFAALERIGGLQRESTNRLGSDIIDLGTQFGVTTDVLVKSLDGLKDNLIDIDLMNLPDHVVESIAHMTARFGPELAPAFEKVVDFILSPALEDIGKREALGLHNAHEMLRNTKSVAETNAVWFQFIEAGNKQFQIFNHEIPGAIAAAVEAFGPDGKLFGPLQEGLTDRQRIENKAIADWADSLNNLRKEVFVPLQMVFMEKLTPILQRFGELLLKLSNEQLSQFSHWIDQALIVLIGWVSKIPGAIVSVLDGFHALVLGFKAMDWGTLWSSIVGVSKLMWGEIVDVFKYAGSEINVWAQSLKMVYTDIKVFTEELLSGWDTDEEEAGWKRTAEAAEKAFTDAMAARDIAKGELGFGVGPLHPTLRDDHPDFYLKQMTGVFKDFKVELDKGDWGTKLIGPMVEPWKQLLGEVAENTGTTAKVLEKAGATTVPNTLNFMEGENQRSMREILGLIIPDKLERVMGEQLDVLLTIEGNQAAPGHSPWGRERGPVQAEL
jgi:hypothetical protein